MSGARTVAKRLVLTVLVAMVVAALAGILPLLGPAGGSTIAEGPAQEQWSPDRVVDDRVDRGGQAEPEGDVGTVLFDRSNGNRFDNEEVNSLVRAINAAGGEVEFSGITTGFGPALEDADVLVIIDPANGYSESELEMIEEFVDDGGRLLILGEPNRKAIRASGFVVSLVTVRSQVDALASRFGISFSTEYVYDQQNNDGNFKDPLTRPPQGTDADAVEGVDRVSMYTAATVQVNRGTVLLRTHGTAERGGLSRTNGYPVAVLSNDGDVMAVGDKTFLSPEYSSVADNEVFIARIVEFMAGANHQTDGFGNTTQESKDSAAGDSGEGQEQESMRAPPGVRTAG